MMERTCCRQPRKSHPHARVAMRARSEGLHVLADSLFTDVGGNGLSVLADQASVVLNRTTIVNAVQRPLEFNFHPLASGGPHAGQYVLNGLIVANGSDAAVLVQVRQLSASAYIPLCVCRYLCVFADTCVCLHIPVCVCIYLCTLHHKSTRICAGIPLHPMAVVLSRAPRKTAAEHCVRMH